MKPKKPHGQDDRATKKNPKLASYGRKGGKARTPAKVAATRTNIKLAGEHLLSRRHCRRCRTQRLGWGNRSGICRTCQRKPKG